MKSKNTDQIDDIREDPFEEYIRMGEPDKADKVSVHIAEILSDRSFTFSPAQYISIHRRLFQGVFSHAGKLRDYNITKNVTNDVFAKHAWYFRNSLVRANYQNVKNGVYEDRSFLETFLRNLLMGEKNELKNRYMHIRWDKTTHSGEKQHIQQHIEIEDSLLEILKH